MEDRRGEARETDWMDRAPAAAGAVLLPVLLLWGTRGEWGMSVPAFLLAVALALVGVGGYLLLARLLGRPSSLTGWFVSGAATVAVASAAAVWWSTGALGWGAAAGSASAGAAVSCWLVFLRILVRGVPDVEGPAA